MAEALDELREFIAFRVREGFESAHEIVESAHDWACGHYERDDLLPQVKRFTAEALAAHRAEQVGWGPTTDCDRLDEAFAALDARGIVARQDFSCCNTCGFTEIWDEVEAAERRGPVEGYVFYHLQCTERAIETGQLLMAYGCVEDDPAAFQRVGHTIVAELRRVGLDASWGGTEGHPIVVEGLVWRRRRP
ncbi:MAG: hypothetical protein J2P46_06035 [Zavarzinella sp.]|nr:hypothetical protein [Zavarzinella sp.]